MDPSDAMSTRAKLIELLLGEAQDALIAVTTEGKVDFWSRGAAAMFGHGADEAHGRRVDELLGAAELRALCMLATNAPALASDLRCSCADRSSVQVDLKARRVAVTPEQPTVVLSFTRAVGDELRALRSPDSHFRDLLEAAPDAMVIVRADGSIQLVNGQLERLFGYRREELLGKPVEMLMPSRYREQHPEHRSRYFADSHPRPMGAGLGMFAVRRDGTEFPAEISLAPMHSAEGMLATAAIRDISERVRNEEVLREAKDAAEAAGRAKSSFLANMSHEIRTPLTALLGFADLMLDPKLGASDRLNYAMTIRRNGEHLLSVLNDILDVSRVEAGKLSVEFIECSPANVLADVASLMRVRASEKRLAFHIAYQTPVPELVRSDPTRMRQILLNLVSNAIKFTHQGSVGVQVRYAADDASDTGQLTIRVTDTGIGMDAEQVARIFKPFAQADASMTRRFGGSGLGLAICAPLAKVMGGTLDVDTAPGRGSTFTLCLPVGHVSQTRMITDPGEALASLATGSARELGQRTQLGGSVLLAEDGYDNQVLVSTLLRKQGFTVDVVENGLLAVEHATRAEREGRPYDVVLMDMQMPELDGYGASSRLRAQGYTRPIVALTAHAMTGERERCIAAGCDDYLAKPVDRAELVRTVGGCVRGGGPAGVATAVSTVAPGLAAGGASTPAPLTSTFADDPLIGELVTTFVAGLPRHVSALQDAANADDRALLTRLAHQLKGAAGGYGFPDITRSAGQLEQVARSDAPFAQALSELTSLCARTQVAERPSASEIDPAFRIPSVLLIDSAPELQALVAARLGSERLTLRSAPSAGEGLALALASPPDLVLLEVELPDMHGFDVGRRLSEDPRTRDVPLVFLTGSDDAATKETAFELGAVDYVTKPFAAGELRARVRGALRSRRYGALLESRAHLDGLTGLWNREHCDARLSAELAAVSRSHQTLSIALVAIDGLAQLGVTYGKPLVDQALQSLAAALAGPLQTSDLAYRFDPERLLVMLPATSESDVTELTERIRREASALTLRARGKPVHVTVSMGVASIRATSAVARLVAGPRSLIEAAERALARAADAGGDRIEHESVLLGG